MSTQSSRHGKRARLLVPLVLGFLLLAAAGQAIHPDDGRNFTWTSQLTIASATVSDITLAHLTTGPEGTGQTALKVVWKQDTSGLFPIWNLYATAAAGLLPPDYEARATPGPDNTRTVALVGNGPVPGRTYEISISYSASHQALAMKIRDTSNDRLMHASGFTVPAFDGPLYAATGHTTPGYIPVSTVWHAGIGSGSHNVFTATDTFPTRAADTALRLLTPAPVPGEYKIYAEYDGLVTKLTAVSPQSNETRLTLPLPHIRWGPVTLRVDYTENDVVLSTERQTISVGYLDAHVQRLQPDKSAGTVYTSIDVQSAEQLADPIVLQVAADVHQLVWNDASRTFDYVPYEHIDIYTGTAQLQTGKTTIPLHIPMPDVPGNWQVTITAAAIPHVDTSMSNNTGLFSTYPAANVQPGEPYTIAVFPDTQFYAQDYPWIYTRLTDWVTTNAQRLNIAAVWHVGDITNQDTPSQWTHAYASQSLLHGVVPYALTLGNHDMTNGKGGQVAQRGLSLINNYFTAAEAQRYSNLVNTMTADRLENHYYEFVIGSDRYLVIALEFGPPDEALQWANDIARQYPHHRLVLLTHSYTATSGAHSRSPAGYPIADNPLTTVNSAAEMWDKFVRHHANSFMVVSGHTSPPLTLPYTARWVGPDHVVYELLFDYQNQDNGGNGWLGLLTFLPDDTVEVQIYSPYLNAWADEIDTYNFTSRNVIDLKSKRIFRIAPE